MTPIQTIDAVYAAFKSGDIPAILAKVAPSASWRQPATLPWGGDHVGPEGAAAFFARLDEAMETVGFEVRENIAQGDEVVSFGTYTGKGRKSGRTATSEFVFRWRVADGKIVAYVGYNDTAALAAALN